MSSQVNHRAIDILLILAEYLPNVLNFGGAAYIMLKYWSPWRQEAIIKYLEYIEKYDNVYSDVANCNHGELGYGDVFYIVSVLLNSHNFTKEYGY